jgi:hypothetical protein
MLNILDICKERSYNIITGTELKFVIYHIIKVCLCERNAQSYDLTPHSCLIFLYILI